mmetsp:Transcript_41089/g.62457  ORF Transcript_41089/g.62457 Transcript_41089/m.62457 type:complete len:149 (+) Transcript_41089:2-448(+)
MVFFGFYCLYFALSALQIKVGIPELMQSYFMMDGSSSKHKWFFKGFITLPFLFELRVLIDWSFTRTSLGLFQWFKLCQIQNELFHAKSIMKQQYKKQIGLAHGFTSKCLYGIMSIIMILGLLIMPLFIYSVDIGSPNPITSVKINVYL